MRQFTIAERLIAAVMLPLAVTLVAVWTGSRAANRYLETITIAYDVERRTGWRRRLLALGITLAGLVGAIAVLPLLVLGPPADPGAGPGGGRVDDAGGAGTCSTGPPSSS